jgi:hypothetical protein
MALRAGTISPKIRVVDEQGSLIESNVYLIEMTLWNQGDLPIEPSDIRVPIRIILNPCARILDSKIVEQNYSEIANFRVNEVSHTSDNPDSRAVAIIWDHFDPGFAVKLQIVYAGMEEAKSEISGYIVGIKKFVNGSQSLLERHIQLRLIRNVISLAPKGLFVLATCILLFVRQIESITFLIASGVFMLFIIMPLLITVDVLLTKKLQSPFDNS